MVLNNVTPLVNSVPAPSVQVQLQLAVLFAAHYTAIRNSVDEWVKRRDQYLMLFITGSVTIFGVFLTQNLTQNIVALLYLIPLFNIVVLLAYASADIHIGYFCQWLKKEYTPLLDRYVTECGVKTSFQKWHWDNSDTLKNFFDGWGYCLRYIFLSLIFVFTDSAGVVLYFVKNGTPPLPCIQTPILLICLSIASAVISIVAIHYLYSKRKDMA
jgi:hypothetical protein